MKAASLTPTSPSTEENYDGLPVGKMSDRLKQCLDITTFEAAQQTAFLSGG